jgi:hypothetical protein
LAVDEEGRIIFLFEGEPTVTPCCKEAAEIVARTYEDEMEEDNDE